MAGAILARWGHIDILVNNAGMTSRAPAVDYPEADWERVIELNLTTVFRLWQRVGRVMIAQKWGRSLTWRPC